MRANYIIRWTNNYAITWRRGHNKTRYFLSFWEMHLIWQQTMCQMHFYGLCILIASLFLFTTQFIMKYGILMLRKVVNIFCWNDIWYLDFIYRFYVLLIENIHNLPKNFLVWYEVINIIKNEIVNTIAKNNTCFDSIVLL